MRLFLSSCATTQEGKPTESPSKDSNTIEPSNIAWNNDTSDIEGAWTFEVAKRHFFAVFTASGGGTQYEIVESFINGKKECEGNPQSRDVQHDGNGRYRFMRNDIVEEEGHLELTGGILNLVFNSNGYEYSIPA